MGFVNLIFYICESNIGENTGVLLQKVLLLDRQQLFYERLQKGERVVLRVVEEALVEEVVEVVVEALEVVAEVVMDLGVVAEEVAALVLQDNMVRDKTWQGRFTKYLV